MVFPYLEPASFERRTRFDADSFDLSDTEWNDTLTEAIEEESAFVRSIAEDGGFDDARFATLAALHDTFPEIRKAVVRLTRDNITGALKDGVTSESLGSGASGSGGQYDYQSSQALRAEVEHELDAVDWRRDQDPTIEPASDVIRLI